MMSEDRKPVGPIRGVGILGRFLTRSMGRKFELLESLFCLLIARVLNVVLPVRWYAWVFGRHQCLTPDQVSLDVSRQAAVVGGAIQRVAGFVPFKSVCLQQAMAAKLMLARRGIPSTFYLGMNRDSALRNQKENRHAAHAWVRVGSRNVVGGQDVSAYVVVSTFA